MTEKEVANAAADKVFHFLSTHMSASTVADAMIVAGLAELVVAFGREGAADMLRRLADSLEAGESTTSVH